MSFISKISRVFILVGFVFALSSTSAYAQKNKQSSLKSKKVLLQDEIQIANEILNETANNRKATVGQVSALNQKIAIRGRIIRTINNEIKLIDDNIEDTKVEIAELEKELQELRDEFAKMIVNAYKSRDNNSKLMYILASENMEQAFKRVQYLQEYSEYRSNQGHVIVAKQEELALTIKELENQKEEKKSLLNEKNGERELLRKEKLLQQETINELLGQENNIKKDIAKKQKEVNRLEAEIQKMIAEEMRLARVKAERNLLIAEAKRLGLRPGKDFSGKTSNRQLRVKIDAKKKEKNITEPTAKVDDGPSFGLTPEAKKLAAGFASNRGKLPWPVAKGIIVGKYGKQPHPVAKGVIENRPHVEIATEKGSEARAVYEGTVSRVFRVQGAGLAVLVAHGNYFTVYSNLSEVYVKSGQKVVLKQKIGKIYTDPKDNQTILEFGLWLMDKSQDPQLWLYK